MATGKRYYWIKLKESFITSDTVDFLMSQKDGANYVVLYQMLCLKTINTDGRLSRRIGEVIIPYDVAKIQRDCKWFSADTIRVALELFAKFGLVYMDEDGTLVMADHKNLVGSETDAAARMRNSRAARNKLPPPRVTDAEQCVNIVTPDIRDKRLDIRDKEIRERELDINTNKEGTKKEYGGEPFDNGSSPASIPPLFSMILNDGTEHGVTESDIDEYSNLYPAVDVEQEIRKMIGWLNANPAKRKTRRGIRNFINGWLSREQDKGGKSGWRAYGGNQPPPQREYADPKDFY
jgi:hypothetical protein